MKSNADQSLPVETVNTVEQFELMDKLPRELKELVGQAPVCVDLRVIYAIWQRFGPAAYGEIETVFNKEFPKWKILPTQAKNSATRRGMRCSSVLLGKSKP